MKLIDIKAMIESGVSIETVHRLHGNTISCNICQEELVTKQLANSGRQVNKEEKLSAL